MRIVDFITFFSIIAIYIAMIEIYIAMIDMYCYARVISEYSI